MYRNTYIEIDTNIIQDNVRNIVNTFNGYDYYIGVVKGNAYGYGEYISKYIVEAGINYLAVSDLDEALSVRKYIDTPILLLEPIDIKHVPVAVENNITLCVSNQEYYKKIKELGLKIKFHLKLNVGMNRLGIKEKEIVKNIFIDSQNDENLELEGVFGHLSTSGVQDIYYKKQVEKFKELLSDIDLSKIKIVHLGRSCTLDFYPKLDICNGVRVGIMMYGVESTFINFAGLKGAVKKIKFDNFRKKNELPEIYTQRKINVNGGLSLYSEVIDVQKVTKGEIVGYGSKTIVNEDCYIAVLPLGYADGISTRYNNACVKINDKNYPVIGTINMGMMTILVDDTVKTGDLALVVDKNISYKQYGINYKVGPYVFLTSLRREIPRKYINNGNIEKVINYNE